MQWSPQQANALLKIKRWINDKSAPQIMRVFGYAGTGKTTLAKEIASYVDGGALFMCFTGKAALVLRKKGCAGASTIHSAIYKPEENALTGQVDFVLNEDSAVADARLVIVDEVSMVGEDIGADLVSFGTKILVLGDPFQLPPIRGDGYFTSQEPDIMLTDIHRQAQDNPIIRMSMEIREGRRLQPGEYGESRIIRRMATGRDEMRDLVLGADQLLCGMNATRQTFNNRVRQLNGFDASVPVVGDRLVCLKNNRMKGLLNGSLWDADKVSILKGGVVAMIVKSADAPSEAMVMVQTPPEFFHGQEKDLDRDARKKADEFTYGYCLTVHKSQGSQWDNVLLFDESAVFRDSAQQHLYTGVTRAAEKVTVVI